MRVCFITSKLDFKHAGGSILEFDLTYKRFQEMGHEVLVITVFSYANNIPFKLPYKVIEENITSRGQLGIQRNIYKILKKYSSQADIFHIDGHSFLFAAGFYRLLNGKIPVSAFFNRELISWPTNISTEFKQKRDSLPIKIKKILRRLLEKHLGMFLAGRIDWMSFTSPFLQREYENFGLKTKNKSMILGDPFDYLTLMQEQKITKDTYLNRNKREGRLTIFYSGRMVAGKGFDLLITAFAKIKDKSKFHLILGGSGSEEHLIKQKIKELGLESYVDLPGWVEKENVYDFYKQADIFIQPRWRMELTSITLLEAMTFGIPSILPAGGGLEWDAKDSALYFKDKDCDDLVRKIEQLGDDYNLREKLSRNCYVRLEEDEMNYKKKIMELYQGMERIVENTLTK